MIPQEQEKIQNEAKAVAADKAKLMQEQSALKEKLNAPLRQYQENLKEISRWEAKFAELTGTPDVSDSLKGLQARLHQLDQLPSQLDVKRKCRSDITGRIFDILDEQRKAREKLYKPVQDLIQSNTNIPDDYRLQFQAALIGSVDTLGESLFGLIKQTSGDFRGEEASFSLIRKLAEQCEFNKREDVINFADQLYEKVVSAARISDKKTSGIGPVLRKNKTASDVYDLLFGLSYVEPRYTLLFQNAKIEQLSPGQRGALLLIFYLIADKEQKPIVLDQPEENLDNETVVSLLVPVLTEAKKHRQIIMVTHNPNLAVVCDAEQIIWSKFDRQNKSKISYQAGSIENPTFNEHVVNVLEGTMPAFKNRKDKYHNRHRN